MLKPTGNDLRDENDMVEFGKLLTKHTDSMIKRAGHIIAELNRRLNTARVGAAVASTDLREALTKLANEASGFRCMADINRHGATNMRVLGDRITEAFEALAAATPPDDVLQQYNNKVAEPFLLRCAHLEKLNAELLYPTVGAQEEG